MDDLIRTVLIEGLQTWITKDPPKKWWIRFIIKQLLKFLQNEKQAL